MSGSVGTHAALFGEHQARERSQFERAARCAFASIVHQPAQLHAGGDVFRAGVQELSEILHDPALRHGLDTSRAAAVEQREPAIFEAQHREVLQVQIAMEPVSAMELRDHARERLGPGAHFLWRAAREALTQMFAVRQEFHRHRAATGAEQRCRARRGFFAPGERSGNAQTQVAQRREVLAFAASRRTARSKSRPIVPPFVPQIAAVALEHDPFTVRKGLTSRHAAQPRGRSQREHAIEEVRGLAGGITKLGPQEVGEFAGRRLVAG